MTFTEAIRTCLTKYVVFSGRARRSEYWFFALFCCLCSIAANILTAVVRPGATASGQEMSGFSLSGSG